MLQNHLPPPAPAKGATVFQWAPTLGGECYTVRKEIIEFAQRLFRFNGHPPLGVNATKCSVHRLVDWLVEQFQWAPTLGVECYLPTT